MSRLHTIFNTHSILSIALAATVSVVAASGCDDAEADPPDLAGTWQTDCTAQDNDGQVSYTISEITDRAGKPRFTVTVYMDAACTMPFFAIANESDRTLGDPVPTAPDAFELDVAFLRLFATPLDDAAVGFLSGAGCGTDLAKDRQTDVSATGCLFFSPISECAGDYDIVKVDGDRLYTGVRGGDMCVPAGRPTELNTFFFTRVGGA